MDHSVHNKIVSFIWSIADDCLRDVYVRGKYRDVILPMFVLRRLDCLLETTKSAVEEEIRFQREEAGLTELDPDGLRDASGYIFYNTSPWTLQRLVDTAANNRSILEMNFKAYLDGFSGDVKEIIDKFKLRAQVKHMAEKDVLLDVLEKFTNRNINLTPNETQDPDGRKLPPLTNLGMGYVFEELIRKFNEENNEEAGEHFTPREVIDLMTHLVFEPVKDKLPPVITIYDPACGSGGMLTESQNFIIDPNGRLRSNVDIRLYGKEINDETYAICKSDMMIKGNDPEQIKVGSTLATDEFSHLRFDFMLSNPPYGKSWISDQKVIMDGKQVLDARFEVELADFRGESAVVPATPRSSDGQLLFLMEMVKKMKGLDKAPAGSRIASVHNGSSLFTGDAGGGESNIRRFIIENDLLEAIIQLPNNLFYNTGITTYIWLLSNKKAEHRQGKVQLIDASGLYRKLRKNLGQKNCEFAPEHIQHITQTCLEFTAVEKQAEDTLASKLFNNQDFGYYKVTIERPARKAAQFTKEHIATLRFDNKLKEPMQWAYEQFGDQIYTQLEAKKPELEKWLEAEELNLNTKQRKALFNIETWEKQQRFLEIASQLMDDIGQELHLDFNIFREKVLAALKSNKVKSPVKPDKPIQIGEINQILNAVSWYEETAEKVIGKRLKLKGDKLAELLQHFDCQESELNDYGYWPTDKAG
ncbi:MAG: SAM-dependent DNA methyltransferase, partial [SAR324 cluster bacterium]|nr:SAM-dependent DNA methyltransferase [SAR324 cluster bacterium]